MGEMENKAEFYYEKLKSQANPGQVLIDFYRDITGREDGLGIILANKLIKMFGRFTAYFAIMELAKYDRLEGSMFPLLFTICKNRFEKAHDAVFGSSQEPLDKEINALSKDIEKIKKSKVTKLPTSEGLK